MKKIIHSTIVLACFSLLLILVQISCQEEAAAKDTDENETVYEPLNKFLYTKSNSKADGPPEFWIANNDGTGATKIPITLPAGLTFRNETGTLTSDGQTLIFVVEDEDETDMIYSVSIDGSNLKSLSIEMPETEDGFQFEIKGAY